MRLFCGEPSGICLSSAYNRAMPFFARMRIIFVVMCALLFLSGSRVIHGEEVSPIELAKAMALDERHGRIFILNGDDTLSLYSFSDGKFVFTRKKLPGIQNFSNINMSPDGSFISTMYVDRFFGRLALFKTEEVLANGPIAPFQTYLFEAEPSGVFFSQFFAREEGKVFLAHGADSVYIFSTEKPRAELFRKGDSVPERVGVGGNPSVMQSDGEGHLLVLNQGTEDVAVIDISTKRLLRRIKVGALPRDLLFNEITRYAYISHIGSDEVYVINPRDGRVVGKIPVGADPTALAYDNQSGNVFVANNSSGTLSIITPSFQVKTVDLQSPAYLSSSPLELWYLQSGRKLFILNRSTAKLIVYDAVRGSVIKEVATGLSPRIVFGSERLKKIFVHHSDAQSILMVDGVTFASERIPETVSAAGVFFSRPQSVAVDEGRNRIYVSNLGRNTVVVIDGSTQKPISALSLPLSLQTIFFNPATRKLYGVSPTDDAVAVVDTSQESYPVKVINVGKQPRAMMINISANRLYVSAAGESEIIVLDGATDEVITRIPVLGRSFPLVSAIDETRNKLYVNLYGSSKVAVIDGNTNSVIKYLDVGQNPIWIRTAPEVQRIFVTVEKERQLVVIDASSDEIIQRVPLSGIPYRIFLDEASPYLYVNFRQEDKVAVLKENHSGMWEVIQEPLMPFWGKTDARPYNMVMVNRSTNLAYFSAGNANRIVVVSNDHDQNGIRDPKLYATITATGEVVYPEEVLERQPSSLIPVWVYWTGGGMLVLAGICILILRRMRQGGSVSSGGTPLSPPYSS